MVSAGDSRKSSISLFICYSYDEHTRAVQSLLRRYRAVTTERQCVGHVGVDPPGKLDEARMEIPLLRLPVQVKGIDRNAVSSKAQAPDRSGEDQKALWTPDGWRCQLCGTMSNLEVHHRRFRSHSGNDLVENLTMLSKSCHSGVHRVRLQVPFLLE